MKLKYYSLVALVKSEVAREIKKDLEDIANGEVKFIDTPTIFLATFESAFTPLEMKNYINQVGNRTFFIYEINGAVSATNIPVTSNDLNYYDHLFKHIEESSKVPLLNLKANAESKSTNVISGNTENKKIDFDVEIMSHKDKLEKIDFLIDKGFENLTEKDKEMLDILTRKT